MSSELCKSTAFACLIWILRKGKEEGWLKSDEGEHTLNNGMNK